MVEVMMKMAALAGLCRQEKVGLGAGPGEKVLVDQGPARVRMLPEPAFFLGLAEAASHLLV